MLTVDYNMAVKGDRSSLKTDRAHPMAHACALQDLLVCAKRLHILDNRNRLRLFFILLLSSGDGRQWNIVALPASHVKGCATEETFDTSGRLLLLQATISTTSAVDSITKNARTAQHSDAVGA